MTTPEKQHRALLRAIATRVMLERGLLPEFSVSALSELSRIEAAAMDGKAARDLRDLLWCSIDNDDSLDLDQLTVAEERPEGGVRVLVAVADVDALVADGSALDGHARHNTTSVYTAARIFPMLPERLSTDLTSLNPDQERLSLVVEMMVDAEGAVGAADVSRARVRNHAKLAYNGVAAWLEGSGALPEAAAAVPGLADNLRLQDRVAQRMTALRAAHGALTLQTIESKAVFDGEALSGLEVEERNRAKTIIEDFMIAANGVIARYLASHHLPAIRRVVRTPKRWDRIVEVAREHGCALPEEPDAKALEDFLTAQRAADPLRFPDLSLAIIKLLGPGEYVASVPCQRQAPGHFGLAVRDYCHSTAPNRRYTDLITQRLLKAALAGQPSPYGADELEGLARHCTEEEDAVHKVERQVAKSAAALLLEDSVGRRFDALVTGASPKGTWVRLLSPPVEGRLEHGFGGLDVGDRLRVALISVDVERGYIDFRRVGG